VNNVPLHQIYSNVNAKKLFPKRSEILEDLKLHRNCDILIVGGGVHGAVMAHLAAFNGFRTVLLEMNDYASGGSAVTDGLLFGDLKTQNPYIIRRKIRSAKDLLNTTKHLLHPVNLTLKGSPPYLFSLANKIGGRTLQQEHLFDANFCSTRYVLDRIFAARQEGARSLNYAKVTAYHAKAGGGVDVSWVDQLSGDKFNTSCGVMINCCGVWQSQLGRITPQHSNKFQTLRREVYTFQKKLDLSPTLLYDTAGRSFTINPFGEKTVISAFEREISDVTKDVKRDEEDIKRWLADNVPQLVEIPFSVKSVDYLRPRGRAAARGYYWNINGGVFSLIGGSFVDGVDIAEDCLRKVVTLSGVDSKCTSLRGRVLAGAADYDGAAKEFLSATKAANIPSIVSKACLERWGRRALMVLDKPEGLHLVAGKVLKGEIDLAVELEQGVYPDDVVKRRFGLDDNEITSEVGKVLAS
jgi:glycerol-3-phosphate dehydrogenase